VTVLLIIEAVVLLGLGLLVVALLASYAGLVERVNLVEGRAPTRSLTPPQFSGVTRELSDEAITIEQLVGRTPHGDDVLLPASGIQHDLLVAFLSSGCTSCGSLWEDLREHRLPVFPTYLRLVVVTRGSTEESPASIAELAPQDVDVIMSSETWEAFSTPGSPYFAYVDGKSGKVVGEGTALTWDQVLGLVATSSGDASLLSGVGRDGSKPRSDLQREEEVDQLLMQAGILPGDPSLYPEPVTHFTDGESS